MELDPQTNNCDFQQCGSTKESIQNKNCPKLEEKIKIVVGKGGRGVNKGIFGKSPQKKQNIGKFTL